MIFILGGQGLLGSAFARVCERRHQSFKIIDRQNYNNYVSSYCDIFVNANGNSSKPLAKNEPLKDFGASVTSVRASLVDFRYERYIHISSCDVYPDCSTPAMTHENRSLDPEQQSPYGFHKYLAEQCVRHVAKKWLIFRLSGLVGLGLRKNAIFDILKGGPLWLQPESALQFLHTENAAEIILDLTHRGISGEVFNLCGKGLIRLREVMDLMDHPVLVTSGSPLVRYDVAIDKISRFIEIPETRSSVIQFIRSELESRPSRDADARR